MSKTKRLRDKEGRYLPGSIEQKREKIKSEFGYSNLKTPDDFLVEHHQLMEKLKLRQNPKKRDIGPLGFTRDFYEFLGIGKRAQNYHHALTYSEMNAVRDMQNDAAEYYTPIDDIYGAPGGQDTAYDFGRIPVSHLMTLCTRRLGVAWRGCHAPAVDTFRNHFEFVKYDNLDKVVQKPHIMKYINDTRLWDQLVNLADFDNRTGMSHLLAYYKGEEDLKVMQSKAPSTRPIRFDSFSTYYMTPINIFEPDQGLDYDVHKWDFRGGIIVPRRIHHSRVYPWVTRRVEGGLRGLALPELCWTALICYLNTMYYILKSLSRLGLVMGMVNVNREFPTSAEVSAYTDLWNEMVANDLIVLGRQATFNLIDSAGKIGQGIEHYLEFLKEDISAAWVFPKNQLFGRAQGGGLDGAGAIVSKEDYLAGNISTNQLQYTNDIMDILTNMCGFQELEYLTLRWNIDLHKTEEQRLKEQIMREQAAQQEIATEQMRLGNKLYKRQMDLQVKMLDVQNKMDPMKLMNYSQKDEENLEGGHEKKPEPKGDFAEHQQYYQRQLARYKEEYVNNIRILEMLRQDYHLVEENMKTKNFRE